MRKLFPVFIMMFLFVGETAFGGPIPIETVGAALKKPDSVRVYAKHPMVQVLVEFGIASWYDCPTKPEMIKDSSRKIRDTIYPVAHKTLPFGTLVKVINPANGRKIMCRVIDRGPFIAGRVIDLDRPGAKAIGISGVGNVALKIFRLAPMVFAANQKSAAKKTRRKTS
jgi:rare lipoprotein A